MLEVRNLKVAIEGPASTKVTAGKKEILKGIDLEVGPGELHVLMGPNGSGKSTLAQVIAGAPQFKVQSAKFKFEKEDLEKLSPDKRARMGIFLAFQHPVEIPGVSVFNVLRRAKSSISPSGHSELGSESRSRNKFGMTRQSSTAVFRNSVVKKNGFNAAVFSKDLLEHASALKLSDDFLSRALNEGFSGGEKKRSEILQMLALRPKLVILDEIDSGLDVDALKTVASAISQFVSKNPRSSVLLITHYARILKYLKPDFVHIMMDGKIIKSGMASLAKKIEEKGYGLFGSSRQSSNSTSTKLSTGILRASEASREVKMSS